MEGLQRKDGSKEMVICYSIVETETYFFFNINNLSKYRSSNVKEQKLPIHFKCLSKLAALYSKLRQCRRV